MALGNEKDRELKGFMGTMPMFFTLPKAIGSLLQPATPTKSVKEQKLNQGNFKI